MEFIEADIKIPVRGGPRISRRYLRKDIPTGIFLIPVETISPCVSNTEYIEKNVRIQCNSHFNSMNSIELNEFKQEMCFVSRTESC